MVQQVDDYVMRLALQIQGDRQLTNLSKRLAQAEKNTGPLQRRIKETAVSTRRFGNVAQNAGYQLQDFIVQVQGGTSVSRALSQQLPQLTVGMGAWGAAIGVAAAAMPALITAMMGAEEAAEPLAESIDGLEESIGRLTEVSGGIDFTAWNTAWNEAEQSVRSTMLAMLEFEQAVAQDNLRKAIKSLNEEIGQTASTLQMVQGAFADFFFQQEGYEQNLRDIEIAEALGIDRSSVNQLQALNRQLQAGSITAEEFSQGMLELASTAGVGTEQFQALVRASQELVQAQKDLQSSQQQIETARGAEASGAAGGGGQILNAPEHGLLEEINVEAKFVTESLLGLTQAQKDFIESVEDGQQTLNDFSNNDLPEQLDIAAESAEIFGRTFETALNGVAMGTQDLSDAVTNMVKVIIVELGKLLAYQGIANLFSGTSIGTAAAGLLNANGNAFSGGDVVPFAKGGIVNRPTVFPFARGVGLMGEAGPEAILPLKRTSSGRLGVESTGMNVIVNNNAPGVAVNPRPSDDGLTIDIVMAQVSAAIDRGGNPISNSIERNYNVGRGRGVY